MHVFIPSKGRPDFTTGKLLRQAGVDYTVFCEPQDAAAYKAQMHADVHVLDANDQGISYARNAMIAEGRRRGARWVWTIDDDITKFSEYDPASDKHVTSDPGHVLRAALDQADQIDRCVVAGLEMFQFAWSSKGKPRFDTSSIQVVALNLVDGWFLQYPAHYMEDRAICMQAITSGYRTVRFTKWAYRTPPMGSNKGGCQAFAERSKKQQAAVRQLVATYGRDIVTPVFKPKLEWWDCRINWQKLKRKR